MSPTKPIITPAWDPHHEPDRDHRGADTARHDADPSPTLDAQVKFGAWVDLHRAAGAGHIESG